jgi:hypothetical protein
MKRSALIILSAALALALVASLTGCGADGSTGGDGNGGSTGKDSGSSGEAITAIEDLQAALKADHGSEAWFADITGMTLETYLGAPVLAIHVTYSNSTTDFETQNANRNALIDALAAYDIKIAPNVALLDADGNIAQAGSGDGGVPMAEAFDLPPAPTTPEGVKQWIDQVYGPGGLIKLGPDETWYAAVGEIEVDDPWDQGDMLVVNTSLPTFKGGQGSLVEYAIYTTGSPLLQRYYIIVGDGTGPVGGLGAPPEGPGYGGFFYPAE